MYILLLLLSFKELSPPYLFTFHSVSFIFQLQCGCFNGNGLRLREILFTSAH